MNEIVSIRIVENLLAIDAGNRLRWREMSRGQNGDIRHPGFLIQEERDALFALLAAQDSKPKRRIP